VQNELFLTSRGVDEEGGGKRKETKRKKPFWKEEPELLKKIDVKSSIGKITSKER